MSGENFGAVPVRKIGRQTTSYPKGRVCTWAACTTRLSRYNPDDRCSLHRYYAVPRIKGQKL